MYKKKYLYGGKTIPINFFSHHTTPFSVFCVLCALFFGGCRPTKYLADSEQLILSHRIADIEKPYEQDALKVLQPKPNRKFLFLFRTNLWAYLWATRSNQNRFVRFKASVKESVGEAPALVDSMKMRQNVAQLSLYLFGKGYFNNKVNYTIVQKSKHKVMVNYLVRYGTQYIVSDVVFEPRTETAIDSIINEIKFNSLIKQFDYYDVDKIEAECKRMADFLREQGYYYFVKDFIVVDADTTLESKLVKLTFKLKQAKQSSTYKPFAIDSVRVNTEYNFGSQTKLGQPTLYKNIWFYTKPTPTIRTDLIRNNILVQPKDLFSPSKLLQTQSLLNAMNVFNYVSVQLKPTLTDTSQTIQVDVLLTPAAKRNVGWSAEGNTQTGNTYGISGNVLLQNKNSFKGGEIFELKIGAGLESQRTNLSDTNTIGRIFNTQQANVGMSLYIPRFAFPFKTLNQLTDVVPKSRINTTFNYENRATLYDSRTLDLTIGYEATIKNKNKIGFSPFKVNFGQINQTSSFDAILKRLNDPFYSALFIKRFVTAIEAHYLINNLGNKTQPFFVRFDVESAGTIGRLLMNALPESVFNKNDETFYGLKYFRYLKFDIDARKYWIIDYNNTLASRLYVGIGVPLGKTDNLPIQKNYFSGGNNSLRAWAARSVGAGSTNSYKDSIDRFGDVKLEFNLEHRFAIVSILSGAVFVDVGNVWTRKSTNLNSNFYFNTFYQQLAVGTGLGMRLDFNFFIFRIDAGLKLRDPAFGPGNRWVIAHFSDDYWRYKGWKEELDLPQSQTNDPKSRYPYFNFINLGIGFPF